MLLHTHYALSWNCTSLSVLVELTYIKEVWDGMMPAWVHTYIKGRMIGMYIERPSCLL